tara:strand:- start:1354 stop:2460 length:1107 start_codon:yes stop_codon:yes gene_type:complete
MQENEEVVEETNQTNQQDSGDENIVKIDESKFESAGDDEVTKVDLTLDPPNTEEVQEVTEETPVVNEVVEDVVDEIVELEPDTQSETEETVEVELPEDMQKLMEFMRETGGDLNDYVKLNSNTDDMDSSEILRDFYKKTKPHLDGEEINFLLEDNFSYDEEMDEERDVKRKKLALKEQVAEAKTYLDGQKSKYYEEIKSGSKLTSEQQEAIEFFNQYNQDNERDTEVVKLQQSTFLSKTDKVFNSEFKGFGFEVDGENMVFNVPNVDEVKDTQKDINNFVGKFLNKDRLMDDAAGYHKSLYTAMNPDLVAKHFYEQGKSDAIKQNNSKAKNINTSRETHKVYEGDNGVTFKVLGDDSSDMKLRIKKRR